MEKKSMPFFIGVSKTFIHHPRHQSTMPLIPILTGRFGMGICL